MLGLKLALSALAVLAVAWAIPFVRAATRSLRTGAPFRAHGRVGGAFPISAQFGKLGALVFTAIIVAIAGAIVWCAVVAWRG
jgi:hypothetical protein